MVLQGTFLISYHRKNTIEVLIERNDYKNIYINIYIWLSL